MKRPALDEDLVPVKEFRSSMASWIRRLGENGRPLVITQRGKAAAVLVHPAMLDELEEAQELVRKVLRGLSEMEAGVFVEDDDVWNDVDRLLSNVEQHVDAEVDTGSQSRPA